MLGPSMPMSRHTWLLNLLKELERVLPPVNNSHHSITYAQYGSSTGWADKIALNIYTSAGKRVLFFDDADFQKPYKQLVADIVLATVANPDDRLSQPGMPK